MTEDIDDLIRRLGLSIAGFERHETISSWVTYKLNQEAVAQLTAAREENARLQRDLTEKDEEIKGLVTCCDSYKAEIDDNHNDLAEARKLELNHRLACRLSRSFNEICNLRNEDDYKINEFLKSLIKAAKKD